MTTTDRVSIDYLIHFEAPFHFGTGLRRGLTQRAVARDPAGFVFVPGSTLKGVARERCERISALLELRTREPHGEGAQVTEFGNGPGIVEDIFGSRCQPGTMFFDDAHLADEYQKLFELQSDDPPEIANRFREFQIDSRGRVQISRLTGIQKYGRLFEQEYGLRGLRFKGRVGGVIRGTPISNDGLTYPIVMLVAALLAIDALGSGRSCGAGKCQVLIETISVNRIHWQVSRVLDSLGDLEYYEVAKQ